MSAEEIVPALPQVDPDPIKYEDMPLERAIAFVKRSRNRRIFLSCTQFAPKADQSDAKEGCTIGRRVDDLIHVSAPVCVKYLEHAYRYASTQGCVVHIGYSSNCLFVGSSGL
jgi:hypothetical protein